MNHTIDLITSIYHVNAATNEDLSIKERISLLEKGKAGLLKSSKTIKKIRLSRNKYSYLDKTLNYYDKAIKFIDVFIEYLQGGTHEA